MLRKFGIELKFLTVCTCNFSTTTTTLPPAITSHSKHYNLETWSINRAKIQISWSIILSYYYCVINQTESDSMVPHVTESFPNLGVLRSQSLQQQLIDTICSNQQEYVCMSALNVIMIATAECKPNFCSWSIPFHRRWEELIFHFCKWGRRETTWNKPIYCSILLQFKSISHWTTTYLLFNASNTVPSNAKADSTKCKKEKSSKNQVSGAANSLA